MRALYASWTTTLLISIALAALGCSSSDGGTPSPVSDAAAASDGPGADLVLGDPSCTSTLRDRVRLDVDLGCGSATPLQLADATLFVDACDTEVRALDPATGDVRFVIDQAGRSCFLGAAGAGLVLLGCGDGTLTAYGSADGAQLWSIAAGPDDVFPGGRIGPDGTVYATLVRPDFASRIAALDPSSGEQRWATRYFVDGIDSFSVAADGSLYLGAYQDVVAVDGATGAERWTAPVGRVSGAPYADDAGHVLVSDIDGVVYGLDASSGGQLWTASTAEYPGEPAPLGGLVLLPTDGGGLFALAPDSGAIVWSRSDVGGVGRAARADDGTLLVPADDPPRVLALDPTDGHDLWLYPHDDMSSSLVIGTDGTVLGLLGTRLVGLDPGPDAVVFDTLACRPCERVCTGSAAVQRCMADGTGPFAGVAVELCGMGTGCSAGACVACTPHDHVECHLDNPTWFDSCGQVEEMESMCGAGQSCAGGRCGAPCQLTCDASSDTLEVVLSCGDSDQTCTNSFDTFGRVSAISCSYGNGRSYSCTLSYDSVGQAHGSCSGEGASCSF